MNPRALIDQAARCFGDRVAVEDRHSAVRFSALPSLVDAVGRAVASATRPGARVIVLAKNSVGTVACLLGLEANDRIRVPLHWRSTALEVANVLADCSPQALVCDGDTRAVACAALETAAARGTPAPQLIGLDDVMREMLHAARAPGVRVGDAQSSGRVHGMPATGSDPGAIVSINYTSGTLGAPKGVVLSRANWDCVYRNLAGARGFRAGDRMMLVGPLSHAAGAYVVPALVCGTTLVLASGATPDALAADLERHRPTILQCVPTVLTRALADAPFAHAPTDALRLVIYGAERMPATTLAAALDRFGPVLAQNYGLTEAMMTCCTLQPHEHRRDDGTLRADTIGRPYPFVEVVVRRPDGTPVEAGEVGELTVRSPHVMQGYWQRPEATAATLRGGWLWSGDLAAWTADGYLELKGRCKDMIVSGGMNLYPAEVEGYLSSLPDVDEVCVFGTSDAAWGERLVAAVVLRESCEAAFERFRARIRAELGIRCPKQWLRCERLPRTGNGKVDVRELRARARGTA